jgi:hypothetical protein
VLVGIVSCMSRIEAEHDLGRWRRK